MTKAANLAPNFAMAVATKWYLSSSCHKCQFVSFLDKNLHAILTSYL
jgi:hypothetical protein